MNWTPLLWVVLIMIIVRLFALNKYVKTWRDMYKNKEEEFSKNREHMTKMERRVKEASIKIVPL